MESSPYLPGKPKPRGESLGELLVGFETGAAGLGTGAASGEPLAGVGANVAANRFGTELLRRLFQRGEDRAQRTMQHAAQRFEERQAEGETPHPDAFRGDSATDPEPGQTAYCSRLVGRPATDTLRDGLESCEWVARLLEPQR